MHYILYLPRNHEVFRQKSYFQGISEILQYNFVFMEILYHSDYLGMNRKVTFLCMQEGAHSPCTLTITL